MTFKPAPIKLIAALASATLFTLAGCGGGGSDTAQVASTTAVIVSPSLGKFSSGARVSINSPDGTVVLGTANIGDSGQASISIPTSYSGPILVVVTGKDDDLGTYYDERTGKAAPFRKDDKLRAIAPAVQAAIGVTPATNAAVVHLETGKGGLSAVTAADVSLSNTKIQTALGITDVLQAPKLVDSSTGNTLDLAKAEDRYALVLAALAMQATGTKTALDVANDFANDLSDDIVDGKKGTVAIADIAYANVGDAFVNSMTTQKITAARQLGNASAQTMMEQDPTQLGTVTANVTAITAPPAGTSATDLQKVKNFFAELRSTLNSITNASNTGFIDTQATKASEDLQANVGTDIDTLGDRVGLMQMAMSVFEDAKNYTATNTYGLTLGTNTLTSGSTLGRYQGSHAAVWYGYGSYDYCWTDSKTNAPTKVTCLQASPNSADRAGNKIRYIAVELTPSTTGYTYTATRYNRNITSAYWPNVTVGAAYLAKDNLLTTATNTVYVPTGSGTITKTQSGDQITAFSLAGTLPPSSTSCVAPLSTSATQQTADCPTGQIINSATGIETIALAVNRTALTGNNYRYALTGSVTTNAYDFATSGKFTKLSLATGSQIDLNESNANNNGPEPIAAKLIGSAQTLATKFTGTVTLASFMNDASGGNYSPTSVVFNGDISDIASNGAGQFLTGDLVASVSGFDAYNSNLPDSTTNYQRNKVTFTGQIQAPGRPLMKLVLSSTATGPFGAQSATLNYSYGTVSITGSGSSALNSLTLTNQDGVQIAADTTNTNNFLVTKSGAKLATIIDNTINYVDGSSESLAGAFGGGTATAAAEAVAAAPISAVAAAQ